MNLPSTIEPGDSDAALAARIATLKDFHQYYRDCLSEPTNFPEIGSYPVELIQWVINRINTDTPQLVDLIGTLPPSGLSPEHELAMHVAMFTILQANLASDHNNTHPNYTLPPDVVVNIKRGLGRVLELHPTGDYIALCVQLLYRIKEIEEVLALSESYPDIFANYPSLRAIVGFIRAMLGQHEQALSWLEPLAQDAQGRNLPLVGLSLMTSQYFTGQTPEWPLSFASLDSSLDALPRLLDQLPPIEMTEPLAATPRPVVFVACDNVYFMQHARHLAYSLHATNVGKLDLHLHLYSPSQQVLDELALLRARLPGLSIGLSIERGIVPTSQLNTYYATARFVRAYQVMQHYRCELCMMDADALFNRAWDDFARDLPAATELALVRTVASPFWERIVAGFAWFRPTPLAERFLADVSLFILQNIAQDKLVWFTDQIALSACDDHGLRGDAAVHYIEPDTVIDLQHTRHSLCWMVTTRKSGNPAYDKAKERLALRYAA